MIPVNDWAQFPQAVRRKLVLELAGIPAYDLPDLAPTIAVQSGEATDCLIGEKMWQRRQERYDYN